MKGPAKKREPGLPPLPPEASAELQALTARLQEALTAGAALEALLELAPARPAVPHWDDHLLVALAALPYPAVPALLAARFGQDPDKARKKALKRALHALKTKGVPVPEDLFKETPLAPAAAAPAPVRLAFVSPIYGQGERYVILEGPKEALGGSFLVTRLGDADGLKECHLLSVKKKQREELWEHFRSQGLKAWAVVPPGCAVSLLEEAYLAQPQGEAAADYAALRAQLWQHFGRPEDAPPLETLLPPLPEAESRQYLERSRDLAKNELFFSWLPAPAEITPWLEKLEAAQHSPLVLSEHQQRARLEAVLTEAVQSLYPANTRSLWSRRLLHMAYFLSLQGREEEAKAAQAAAQDLAAGPAGALKGENTFLLELVRMAVTLAEGMRQQKPEASGASGLIAPPTPSLIHRR